MGYCVFNNVALAARAALDAGVPRVLVVDFDAHDGNGTRACLRGRPDCLHVSLHQAGLFPETTGGRELPSGPDGSGAACLPMAPGAGDAEYAAAFREVVEPIADAFRPGLVLVSAGFDGHRDDPMSDLDLTDAGYAAMTASILAIARRFGPGRVGFVLEGGYDPASLGRAAAACLDVLRMD